MTTMEEIKDDEMPSNVLENFSELEEVLGMIDDLKECYCKNFEKTYEKFVEILSRYQEQPHLLDPHLPTLLNKLLTIIKDKDSPTLLVHGSFKYMYTISKVRTYKALVKFLPHELSDLEFALDLLEKQDLKDSANWETRYVLLLWMSILVLNPFHMSRLDAYVDRADGINHSAQTTKMERIFNLCLKNIENNDTCSSIAAFLCGKYIIRVDVKELYMKKFFEHVMRENNAETETAKYGQLAAVASILKNGKRDDLLEYIDMLLKWILSCNYKNDSAFLKYKHYIKIIQRIGLVYLKPRVASWRYKRGVRSLAITLRNSNENEKFSLQDSNKHNDDEEDIVVPDGIEDVIEELLGGLRSASSDIRWSAAKGIGRVTNRLSKCLGDEVVGSVIDILDPFESNEGWHGACLAIAELSKRGLLLPYRLKTMVPLLLQALFYDEIKGYMSVGQHIRDAACYMCWAFARAYDPEDLQPFVKQIAAGLLAVAVFDREINCRRAASAAFQESVGRLGNFPHGIDILTVADFYSVGMRSNCFLKISCYIAQFEEYKKPLIDHLIERKICHWDAVVRDLTAKALHKLTWSAPEYIANEILPKLFAKTTSVDVTVRHGSVLAIGEITLALKLIEDENKGKSLSRLLSNQVVNDLNEIISRFLEKDSFRGVSGEIMKECCTSFINNCSKAKIEVNSNCIASWQEVVDKSLINKNSQIRENASLALNELCKTYYSKSEETNIIPIVEFYIKRSENDLEEEIRMGYISALGALPKFMITMKLNEIVNSLIKHSLPPKSSIPTSAVSEQNVKMALENPITYNWSEARRESIKALANVVQTVGFENDTEFSMANPKLFSKISECYLKALEEYTLDNRGDIGAWVREAAMTALFQLITTCPRELLTPSFIHQVMTELAQQAVEKIDRTRGLAGRLFYSLVFYEPKLPYIMYHQELRLIFPEDNTKILWLFADHTFPYFCSMLKFAEYSPKIILGLTASIGQLTESLVKYSSTSFFDFLRANPETIPRICNEIIKVFEQNSMNERVTYPILNFLDILLSSGVIEEILIDENSNFANEIYRLVSIEIKGHKKLYKLASSINVFSQLIQVPQLMNKIFSKMAIFLGLTHVHIRKTTATKLYEALALYGENCNIDETKLEKILELLSETDWGMSLNDVRPIRNEICMLLGIKPPVSAGATSIK
ncbi:tubulin-specific chaperone D [Condylostylus longicornis]|uniref:tubulin-specific chaperone D n=1 Tax=Condylostylus longicornis TaxID=2530218 RepID=UPI00244E296C|nr:tubulin-specific chaperone D [Condylostylus longicornis]